MNAHTISVVLGLVVLLGVVFLFLFCLDGFILMHSHLPMFNMLFLPHLHPVLHSCLQGWMNSPQLDLELGLANQIVKRER